MTWIYHLLVITILLIFLQSAFFRKMGLDSVSVFRRFSSRYAFEGEEIQMLEEISNNRPIPVPLLIIESRINKHLELSAAVDLDVNESNYHRSIFTMLPFTKLTRKHKVILTKRGHYDMKSIIVSTYDLLGFSKVTIDDVPVDAIITVYPRFLDSHELTLPCHSFLGDAIVRRWIIDDPFLNAGVRAYQLTDPLKNVNWKASARTGSLQVNKHDYSANTKLLIVFNVDLEENQWYAPADTTQLEYALSLCATYAKCAIDNGMEVSYISNGSSVYAPNEYTEIPSGSGEQHLYTILEALALMKFNHVHSFHYFLSQFFKTGIHDTDILIISHYVDSEIQNQVDLLRFASNAVEIILPGGGATNG